MGEPGGRVIAIITIMPVSLWYLMTQKNASTPVMVRWETNESLIARLSVASIHNSIPSPGDFLG